MGATIHTCLNSFEQMKVKVKVASNCWNDNSSVWKRPCYLQMTGSFAESWGVWEHSKRLLVTTRTIYKAIHFYQLFVKNQKAWILFLVVLQAFFPFLSNSLGDSPSVCWVNLLIASSAKLHEQLPGMGPHQSQILKIVIQWNFTIITQDVPLFKFLPNWSICNLCLYLFADITTNGPLLCNLDSWSARSSTAWPRQPWLQ